MSIFCKHEWKMLSETTTKSKLEVSMDAFGGGQIKVNLPWQLSCADRKHIQTFSCEKCGKIKRYVENI